MWNLVLSTLMNELKSIPMTYNPISEYNVMYVQVFDESALSQRCKEEMYKCYPDAKRAHLKSGGNFPYLSRSGEVNLMIQVRHKPCSTCKSMYNTIQMYYNIRSV